MQDHARGWLAAGLAALFFILALSQTSSCATTQEWLVLVGLALGWLASAAAIRYFIFAKRGRGNGTRVGVIATSLALALIPAFLATVDAGFMQSDYCCTAHGCL